MRVTRPVFYYDLSSPFAYLAAERIDELLPSALWRPISFGILLRESGRVPWSLDPATRPGGIAEVERRAAERGLAPVRWPAGWPADSYSITPLRALYFAERSGRLKQLTRELFRVMFAEGTPLDELEATLAAARACGFDAGDVRASIESDSVRKRLRDATAEAIERGVVGVPTVAVGDELFWGDDRLEEAAAAAGGSRPGTVK